LLRTAIISTGIGALIVGITYLITKIQEWTSSTDDQIDSQEALKNATEDLNGALTEQYSNIDRLTKIEAQRARIAGQSETEIEEIEGRATKRKIATLDFLIAETKKLGASTKALEEERADLVIKLQDEELERRVGVATKVRSAQKEAADKREAELKKEQQLIQEGIKLEEQLRRQLIGMVGTEEERALNQAKQNLDDNLANLKKYHLDGQLAWSIYFAELRRIQQEHYTVERMNLAVEGTTKAVMTQQTQDMITHLNDASHRVQLQQSVERQRMTDFEWERRKEMLAEVGTMTQSLISIVGEQTAAGKALGVAQAIINTYTGATEVLRSPSVLPEPFGTISKIANVAAIIATGFKAVKAITSVKVPGKGGGGSAPTAITPQLPVTATTQIRQDQANNQGNAAGRTFVLESDVSGNQERIRMLNRAARIN
jgi:hypothetical protein